MYQLKLLINEKKPCCINHDIIVVRFAGKLTYEAHMRGVDSPEISVLAVLPLLFRHYYRYIHDILELFYCLDFCC